jgi:hypothetical protein
LFWFLKVAVPFEWLVADFPLLPNTDEGFSAFSSPFFPLLPLRYFFSTSPVSYLLASYFQSPLEIPAGRLAVELMFGIILPFF